MWELERGVVSEVERELAYWRKPVRVAATKEMSSMAAVETHMASVYRRISNPLALSTTSYAGHSMRSHVGGTATAAATASSAAAPATRTSNLLLRRAMLCFILSLALLLLMRVRGRRFGSGAIASLGLGIERA